MNDYACACGYEVISGDELADHIGDMVIPDDDTALDGVLHAEAAGQARHRCLCGLAARTGAELDEHLLAVFMADGAVGRDGRRHGG